MGFFSSLFGNKNNTSQSNVILNISDIGDVCYALGCMVGCAAANDPDESCGYLFVRVHNETSTTEIYANCANWITNHKNIGDYLSLKIPNYIAEFLTKVDLTQENNGALTISFNYTSNSINIEEKIKKGLILVPYPLEMRQLKSYMMNNENTLCVDLSVAKD